MKRTASGKLSRECRKCGLKMWQSWEEGLGFGADGVCGYKGDVDFQSHGRSQRAGAEFAKSKGGCLSVGPCRAGLDVLVTFCAWHT